MARRREWSIWEIVVLILIVEAVGAVAAFLLWWGLSP